MADNADTDSAVLILASSEYEAMVSQLMADNAILEVSSVAKRRARHSSSAIRHSDTSRRVLLFESNAEIDGVTTVMISRYGVSWLAGAMSQGFNALILAAAEGMSTLEEAVAGFRDARAEYAGEADGRPCTTTLHYLAGDASGFAMPDSAYRYVARLIDNAYAYDKMIFPLLGGSVTGLLRCMNDDDLSSALMIGMDVDMTGRCSRLPFSVVIRIGDVVRRYLDDWHLGREWPQRQRLGINEGAADIVITPNFGRYLDIWDSRYEDPDTFKKRYEQYKEEAIRKEEEHEC